MRQEQLQEIVDMQRFCEEIPFDDPESICTRLVMLGSYNARTGSMLAEAKLELDNMMKKEIMTTLKMIAKDIPFCSATTANRLIDSCCVQERYVINCLDRLNSTTAKQMIECQSLLAFERQRMATRT